MSKIGKKNSFLDRLNDEIEAQGLRLEQLVSVFYPDGVQAEYSNVTQVREYVMSLPTFRPFSEDRQALAKCLEITKGARTKEYDGRKIGFSCTEINFIGNSQLLRGLRCSNLNACIMFRVTPGDPPVYLKDEYIFEGFIPRFLVDYKSKDAFIVMEDYDYFENARIEDYKLANNSFIKISEFHAIVFGDDFDDDDSDRELYFMTSFSQEGERCYAEKIYSLNRSLLDQLFPPPDETNEPVTGLIQETETIPEVADPLPPNSDGNEAPPPPSNGADEEDITPADTE